MLRRLSFLRRLSSTSATGRGSNSILVDIKPITNTNSSSSKYNRRPSVQSMGQVTEPKKETHKKPTVSVYARMKDPLRRITETGDLSAVTNAIQIANQLAKSETSLYRRAYSYNILMSSLLKRAESDSRGYKGTSPAAQKCIEVYQVLRARTYILPTTTTYNLAMKAMLILADKDEGVDADVFLALLAEMKTGKISKPDNISYSTLLNALGRSRKRSDAATGPLSLSRFPPHPHIHAPYFLYALSLSFFIYHRHEMY